MWWIILIVAAGICSAISSAAEEEEKKNTEKEKKLLEAKQPDALIRLFSEEFPDFGNDMTFSKAQEVLKTWNSVAASSDYKKHVKFFDNTSFKSEADCQLAMSYMMREIGGIISSEFREYANENVEYSYSTMRRAITASLTLAGVE